MLTALLITLAAVCPAFGVPVFGTGYDRAWNEYTLTESGIGALTPAELTALRARITALFHADVAYIVTRDSATPGVIAAALVDASQRPVWRAGLSVTVGQVYQYQRNVYEVVQAHRTQSDWTPTVARSLWTRYRDPNAAPEAWVQPVGAHDAYRIGEKVTFGGFTWQNTIAANVWQPGVTGWTNLTPPPPQSAWAFPVAYKVNDEVTYQGNTYRCRQAHTSQAAWTPTAVPALWLRI